MKKVICIESGHHGVFVQASPLMAGLRRSQHLKLELKEIQSATQNFTTCVGNGGFGKVYKGELKVNGEHTTVAVKRLTLKRIHEELVGQGLKEFLTEIKLLSALKHENLISLLGFCQEEEEKILVYEYAEHGSLDKYIRRFGSSTYNLTWVERLKICADAARGLDHLHRNPGKGEAIIHRDVKSSNILLDKNWVAKISDLGLSKLIYFAGLDESGAITNACGTFGYCDPKYISSGIVTKESDVYSFGVVLFEVLCGRLCLTRDNDGFILSADLAKKYYKEKKLDEIIDPRIREQISPSSLKKYSKVAYDCLHDDRDRRPQMQVVTKVLEETLEILKCAGTSDGFMNLSSMWWKPFTRGDKPGVATADGATACFSGGGEDVAFKKDGLLWHTDIGKYGGGMYSMAVVQANQVLEDQSQIESGPFGTFVGVYDGHGGPDVARYVCDNLFRNFQATSGGVVTPETIRNVFLQTENGFTALVSESFNSRPNIAIVGTCCLVGVIYQQTLFIANLGDSRVVLGKKVGNTGGMAAIQLSSEHTANLEEVRHELKDLHPHDPDIVALKHGVWRVKGITQFSKSIGDVYMKHAEYNNDQIAQRFRLPEATVMPILSATPSIVTHEIQPNDSFLIFASDGLWEYLSNEEAVKIVHNNPRSGIAKRLVKAALQGAAKKRDMKYSDLIKIDRGVRRHFHDDITVIVLFLNYDQICRGGGGPNVSLRSALEH